ncbi:MAG: amidohydrolase [Cytophagales bacterium]
MNLHISIIQTKLFWEDIDANLAMLEEKIWQVEANTDLILLPEMFSTGFTNKAPLFAEPMNGKTFKWMKQQAAQTTAAIVGSYIVRADTFYYNRLIWMQPDGKYFTYDKRHTFSLSGEDKVYMAGNQRLIVNWRGWKICPMICYDLRFPIWSRNKIVDQIYEYDLLLFVANWPDSRNAAWETLLKARAIENSCFCAGANIVGKDGNGLQYIGNSSIYNPLVENMLTTNSEDNIFSTTISKVELDIYRKKYPFLEDGDGFELKKVC